MGGLVGGGWEVGSERVCLFVFRVILLSPNSLAVMRNDVFTGIFGA